MTMGLWRQRAAIIAVSVVLAGCWYAPGQGPTRHGFNGVESDFGADSLDEFTELWTAETDEDGPRGVGHPVTSSGGLVHVTTTDSVYTFESGNGNQRWAVTPEPYAEIDTDMIVAELGGGGGDEALFPSFRRNGQVWEPAQMDISNGSWFTAGTLGRTEAMRLPDALLSEFRETPAGTVEHWYSLYFKSQWGLLTTQPNYASRLTLGEDQFFHAGVGVGTEPANGIRAFSLEGGDAQWAVPIDGTTTTSPVVSSDYTTVFVGTDAGTVYALDTVDGTVLWSVDVGSSVTAAVAVAYETVFVPTESGALVSLSAEGCGAPTCEPLWSAPAGESLAVQPAVAADVVFTGSTDGQLSGFDAHGCGAAQCEALWSDDTGSRITGAPAVAFGKVFAGTQDGRLVAYGLPPE